MAEPKKPKNHSRLLWFILFLILAALTLRALTVGTEDFSVAKMKELVANANPLWVLLALGCVAGFIFTEAWSLRLLERFFGHARSMRRNTVYSAADIYFSAITPSATGGQPASAVFMLRDGIPAAVTTMALLLNIMLYTASILVVALLCFLIAPGVFFAFGLPSRVLIVLGICLQALFATGLFLLVIREKLITGLAGFFLRLGHRLHLVRNIERRQEALHRMADEYRECIHAFRGGLGVVLKSFALNVLQRFCNIGVTLCVFMAIGGSFASAPEVLVTQGFVVLGSNAIPIPGAVGVADYLFLDGFEGLVADVTCVELLSRGLSFYACLIFSGAIILLALLADAVRRHRRRKDG